MKRELAERLFNLGCSTISHAARIRLVHDTSLGLAVVRHFYSWLCTNLTGTGEHIDRIDDVCLDGRYGTIPLRLYGAQSDAPVPAIIFLHGGCFTVGNLESHDGLCRALANASSCLVISVDYRLSPENPFPAAADDAYRVLEWAAANAASLHIDPNRIGLAGDSAGGAIAAVVARWARDRRGPALALQLLLYPLTDAAMRSTTWQEFASGPVINRSILATAWTRYSPNLKQRLSADVSPLAASDLRGLPPAIVVTADRDPLRDEGEAYARALDLANVHVSLLHYKGTVHGFLQTPGSPISRQALSNVAFEMAKILKHGETARIGSVNHSQDAMALSRK